MVEVRLDGEKLLASIEAIERELNAIRREAALGAAPAPSVQGIDLTQIDWRTKDNEEASLGDEWCWAFAYNRDGSYKDESKELVQRIEQYGKVEIDGYVMTLSGRDKRLLNRKRAK